MIRQILFLAGLFLCMPQGGKSQPIDELLQQIERNNKSLQALRQENEAARQEIRSQNNLEDPSVEYSPFYTKGTDGMSSSELVVSQGFDFPTRYAARRKSGRLQSEYLDRQYLVARRDLLLGARLQCLDLIRLNRTRELLEARLRNAGELLALFEKRLEEGDASILEVNKIRMERMNATTELAQNESARQQVLAALQAMNGDQAVAFGVTEYPEAPAVGEYDRLRDELLAAELEVQASESAVRAAGQEVRLNRQNWLPSLEVGYRRNTALDEASNGFLIGASFPIFSNRHKSRMTRARYSAAQLRSEEVRLQADARIRAQYDELGRLQETMQTYDTALMHTTLEMLRRAVEDGQLSVIEYYTEADGIYRNLQTLEELENRYHALLAELFRNSL